MDWVYTPADGVVRGILVIWDEEKLVCRVVEKGKVSLSIPFENQGYGKKWVFSRVYCRGNREERERLWEELSSCKIR